MPFSFFPVVPEAIKCPLLSQDGYLEKDIGLSHLFRVPVTSVLMNISQTLSLEPTHLMFSRVNELKDSSSHSKLILIALVVKSP